MLLMSAARVFTLRVMLEMCLSFEDFLFVLALLLDFCDPAESSEEEYCAGILEDTYLFPGLFFLEFWLL